MNPVSIRVLSKKRTKFIVEKRHLPNINKITTVIWMRLHWIQQETSHWKLLSQALCRLRQTWLLHDIYYIMLHHYAWVTFRRFSLQCFNYVFANDSQDPRDQQKSPSLQKPSYWSNTYLCTAPWTHSFMWQCKSIRVTIHLVLLITHLWSYCFG